MAAKLKTFCYSDGFHAWTVAASSRAKALQAFGVTRDLFKDSSAKEIQEGPDREAALASPGELIERGLAVDVGKVAKAKPAQTKPPSKAQLRAREAVETLEADLAALVERQAKEMETLEARRAKLEAEFETLAKSQTKARDALKAKLRAARAKVSG